MGRKRNTWQAMLAKTATTEKGCLEWQGCRDKDGYGLSSIGGIKMAAHRALWSLFRDPEEIKGKYLLHSCNNPCCINIDHLYIGTQKQNIQDQVIAGTFVYGSKNGQALLKEEDVLFCRSSGMSVRQLADKFNVSYYTIWDVLRGRSWKHLK